MAVAGVLLCSSKATEFEFSPRNFYPAPIRCREFKDLGSVRMKFDPCKFGSDGNKISVNNANKLLSPTQVSKVKEQPPSYKNKCRNNSFETFEEKFENTRFTHLYPEEFDTLSTKNIQLYDKDIINPAIRKLKAALQERNITYHTVYGREKSLNSIYKKMSRKNMTIDKIYDIYGVRIVLETLEDCFLAFEIITQLWPTVLKFKDYITNPKPNGYRSLHTVVIGEENLPIEIQIRNREMHIQAEYGNSAHWRYKQQQLGEAYHN